MKSAVMTFNGKPSAVWLLASPLRSKTIRSAALRMRLYLFFVDAIHPDICAWEWMIKSGAIDSSQYLQAVADIEDIRSKACFLACDLSELSGEKPIGSAFTKNGLN